MTSRFRISRLHGYRFEVTKKIQNENNETKRKRPQIRRFNIEMTQQRKYVADL